MKDPKTLLLIVSMIVAIGAQWIGLLVPEPYTDLVISTLKTLGEIAALLIGLWLGVQRLESRIMSALNRDLL